MTIASSTHRSEWGATTVSIWKRSISKSLQAGGLLRDGDRLAIGEAAPTV
jgi:hypothetical protein